MVLEPYQIGKILTDKSFRDACLNDKSKPEVMLLICYMDQCVKKNQERMFFYKEEFLTFFLSIDRYVKNFLEKEVRKAFEKMVEEGIFIEKSSNQTFYISPLFPFQLLPQKNPVE